MTAVIETYTLQTFISKWCILFNNSLAAKSVLLLNKGLSYTNSVHTLTLQNAHIISHSFREIPLICDLTVVILNL